MKFIFICLFFIFLSFDIYGKYIEKKIPKPDIKEFSDLKSGDLTDKYQININIGGDIWVWTNTNDSEVLFKINTFSIILDKYDLFFKGFSFDLDYNFEYANLVFSALYKLKLYNVFYGKAGGTLGLYPNFDLGVKFELGFEFEFFDFIKLISYTTFSSFLINKINLTTLNISYYTGVGFYF